MTAGGPISLEQGGHGMARYADGFVLPVPKRNAAAYRRIARRAGKIWREHGALEYRECIAEDVKPGKHTSFPQSVRLQAGEVVWFSWIVFKSRKHRDRVNARVMKDPRLASMMDPKKMPFDGKRMIYGGFEIAVDA
jgi:uncharacterized protein YbaA (DUF1428 family)